MEHGLRTERGLVTTRDGVELAVQTAGPPDAPALLLLQGQANSHDWWTGLRETFQPDYRTVTFDYRGTGGSHEVGKRSESTTSFAADACDVFDALGIARAHVYGTSMGGRIAQMLAIEHPHRVDRLLLACTSPGGPAAVRRPREVGRALARLNGTDYRTYLSALFYTPDWPGTPADSHLLGDPGMSATERAMHLRISAQHNAWDRLPEITAPTLILHGDADRMNPSENAELLAARIPEAQTIIYPGGRHGFFEEFAEAVNHDIVEFLAAGRL